MENGGAIFIPKGYFSCVFDYDKTAGNYLVIELGMPYAKIRQSLRKIGYQSKGSGDMIVEEVTVVTGGNDKGGACRILIELLNKKFTEIKTIGIGDSHSDIPMLKTVDIPVLVQKEEGYWEEIELPGLIRVPDIGPRGWRTAIWGVFGA